MSRSRFKWTSKARRHRKSILSRIQSTTAIPDGPWSKPHPSLVKIVIVLVLVIGGVFFVDQGLKKPGQASPLPYLDPQTTLWVENFASDSLNAWSVTPSTVTLAVCHLCGGLVLQSNSTHPAIAISNQAVDLSTVSTKTLGLENAGQWQTVTNCCTFSRMGWFLTRNSTLPSNKNYDPYTDSNVAMVFSMTSAGGGNLAYITFIQRYVTDTIGQEDAGNCETGSSCLVATTASGNLCVACPIDFTDDLNFTGNGGTSRVYAGNGAAGVGVVTPTPVSVQTFPWLRISGQQYYMGYFMLKKSNQADNSQIFILPGSNTVYSDVFTLQVPSSIQNINAPTLTSPAQSPNLDTSGFFGPLIQALISVAVFIFAAVAKFFSFVYSAFVAALDTMGNFLGVGPIGTNIANALAVFASWVASIFGTAFSQITNGISFIINSLTSITNFLASWWTQLTNWLAILQQISTFLWTVLNTGLQFGTMTSVLLFTVWWSWGMLSAIEGMNRWYQWTRISADITLKAYKFADYLYEKVLEKIILRFKKIIFQWF